MMELFIFLVGLIIGVVVAFCFFAVCVVLGASANDDDQYFKNLDELARQQEKRF